MVSSNRPHSFVEHQDLEGIDHRDERQRQANTSIITSAAHASKCGIAEQRQLNSEVRIHTFSWRQWIGMKKEWSMVPLFGTKRTRKTKRYPIAEEASPYLGSKTMK